MPLATNTTAGTPQAKYARRELAERAQQNAQDNTNRIGTHEDWHRDLLLMRTFLQQLSLDVDRAGHASSEGLH